MPQLLGQRPSPPEERAKYLSRYSLVPERLPAEPAPLDAGSWWYDNFFKEKLIRLADGTYRFPYPNEPWGKIAGGHSYAIKPPAIVDRPEWWSYYNQHRNNCTAYAASRCYTLHYRRLMDPNPLYDETLRTDEFPGEADEGTSVNATLAVLHNEGPWTIRAGRTKGPVAGMELSAYLWISSIEHAAACLSPIDNGQRILDAGCFIVLNSWGKDGFPHETRMPLETADKLWFRDPNGNGDLAMPVFR